MTTPTTIGEYIAQNGAKPLYSVGPNWVGVDAKGALMLFPAQWEGWSRRRTYHGHLAALGPVISSVNAIGTGYPAWESQ